MISSIQILNTWKTFFFSPDEAHALLFFQLTCPSILVPIAFTHTKAQSWTNMNPQQTWRVPMPKTHFILKLRILKMYTELSNNLNPRDFKIIKFPDA